MLVVTPSTRSSSSAARPRAIAASRSGAQTMAVYVAKQPGFGDRIGLFAAIDETRFKRIVVPGDVLRLEVTMEKLGSRFGRGRGVASVDGDVACQATLSFIIPPEGVLR